MYRPFRARPRVRPAAAILLALAWLALAAPPDAAEAHANITRSDPPGNAVLQTSPRQVQVWFDEPIEPALGHLEVFDSGGRRVDNLDTRFVDDGGPSLIVTLPALPNGTYVVSWRVLSTGDAHSVGGAFAFAVGEGVANVPLPAAGNRLDPAAAALQWLGLIGQGVLFGAIVFRMAVWRRVLLGLPAGEAEADQRYARRMTQVADVVRSALVIGTAGDLFYQARAAGISAGTMLATQWGLIWIARMVLVLGLAGFLTGLMSNGRWARTGLVAAGCLLATTSLVSHSASLGSAPLVFLDWIHLVSTSVWAGGVVAYFWAARDALNGLADPARADAGALIHRRFSSLAAAAVGGTLISGVLLALSHVGSWGAMLFTAYGSAFQWKMALVVTALLLGAANLFFGRAKERGAGDKRPTGFWIRLGLESAMMAGIFSLSVWLTDLPRAANAPLLVGNAAVEFSKSSATAEVGGHFTPARIGGNQQFSIYLRGAYGQRLEGIERVELTFAPVGGGALTSTVEAQRQLDGSYSANGAYFTRRGEWQLLVGAQLSNGEMIYQSFDLRIGPDDVARLPSQKTPWTAELLGWLRLHGGKAALAALVAFAASWAWLAYRAAPRGNRPAFAGLLLPSVMAIAGAWYLWLAGWVA